MKKAILAEIFIWGLILTILYAIGFLAYDKFYIEPNTYIVQFKDIDGITKGSPVRFMGINVGHVRKLKSKDKHINVDMLITQKNMQIPNGTIARVEFYGLGGSKSIELMPPDGSCNVGISTNKTIRLNDVAKETKGLVEIIEAIEKYTKGLDRAGMQRFLEKIRDIKDDDINNIGDKFDTIGDDIGNKVEEITKKQDETTLKIKKINENVEKINKLIKK